MMTDERDSSDGDDDLEERLEDLELEVEERLDDIEVQVEDISVGDIEKRMRAIEKHQAELQDNIDALAERAREESDVTPHINSVETLYEELLALEERMVALSEELHEVTDEDADEETQA